MADFGIVYCVTRLLDGARYIGITTRPLSERWSAHVSASRRKRSRFCQAIRSDGRNGFILSVVEEDVPTESLPARERHWIAKLDTFEAGLNGNRGGSTCPKRKSGFIRTAERLAKESGACLNTARRWVREGSNRSAARVYRGHGATGTRIFNRWHDMAAKGGLSPEWRDFGRFSRDIAALATPGHRISRIETAQPWGPENVTLRRYGSA